MKQVTQSWGIHCNIFCKSNFWKLQKYAKLREDLALWDAIINSNFLISVSCCQDILSLNYTASLCLLCYKKVTWCCTGSFEVRTFLTTQTYKRFDKFDPAKLCYLVWASLFSRLLLTSWWLDLDKTWLSRWLSYHIVCFQFDELSFNRFVPLFIHNSFCKFLYRV